jgi:3-deoxy-D-manno-octulosonate 8-phosphate phosphatase (KDO 8-P phosphatase)
MRKSQQQRIGLARRAKQIHLLLMDVDGVLTDGRVYLQSFPDGSAHELKVFHAHDGLAIKAARTAGLRCGVITGRKSAALALRAKEMNLEFIYEGQAQKLPAFDEILAKAGVRDEDVAYIGDDLPDVPILNRVGLAIAVANASAEVKRAAHLVTKNEGGHGAVREVVELILKAQGKWADAIRNARA